MGKGAIEALVTVLTAIVGLAIVAVIVSKNAQTGSVLAAAGNALSGAIGAAVKPVSDGTAGSNTELGQIGHLFPQ
jgi:PRD1 phage membrane DNA delivery